MAELQNPLFEDEKEFLERKKLEYERALRGDVEHIKDQSLAVGKVALAGAGVLGGLWLLSKAFGGKRKKPRRGPRPANGPQATDWSPKHDEADDFDPNAEYYTDGMGKRHKTKHSHKDAQASAQAFMAADGPAAAPGGRFGAVREDAPDPAADKYAVHSLSFEEDDPFQSLPYDDSRRLPDYHPFDHDTGNFSDGHDLAGRPNKVGAVLQAFLQSDTGKMLTAQAAAVVLALVTKKVSEFFPAPATAPTAKNADLAAASAVAPVAAGAPHPAPAPASSDAAPPSYPA